VNAAKPSSRAEDGSPPATHDTKTTPVKPHGFEYLRANSLDEALELLAARAGEARPIAGGQSLVPIMNLRLARPEALVDIGRVEALRGIAVEKGVLRLGALTLHRELAESPLVAEHAPLLSRAAPYIGHEAIRNRGTLGGSLAHADPAAELPACVLALEGRIVAASRRGRRTLGAEQFFLGPYTTALEPDELVVAVEIPLAPPGRRVAFHELARRTGDYAMAGGAALARKSGAALREVRLAFFGVASRPVLARAAAAAIEGRAVGPDVLAAAQKALGADVQPQADLHHSAPMKAHLVRVLLGRLLEELAA
jgi:aerobic carbon-monoxide dehydrogenase medium subunit